MEILLGSYGLSFIGLYVKNTSASTIQDREHTIKAACYETAAIVEDWRDQCVGRFCSTLDLFGRTILPNLLFNSDTWVEVPRDAEEKLEKFTTLVCKVSMSRASGNTKYCP